MSLTSFVVILGGVGIGLVVLSSFIERWRISGKLKAAFQRETPQDAPWSSPNFPLQSLSTVEVKAPPPLAPALTKAERGDICYAVGEQLYQGVICLDADPAYAWCIPLMPTGECKYIPRKYRISSLVPARKNDLVWAKPS